MDVIKKILENVREQGKVARSLRELQAKMDECSSSMAKLSGQMELLAEIFKEERGMDVNAYLAENENFREMVRAAGSDPSTKLEHDLSAKQQFTNVKQSPGTTMKTGNKTMPEVALAESVVARKRQPPTIVVTDEPPTMGDDDDD